MIMNNPPSTRTRYEQPSCEVVALNATPVLNGGSNLQDPGENPTESW